MTGYCHHKMYLYLVCLAVMTLALVSLLSGTVPARAALSSSTERFYGYVYNDGKLVPCGYVITATIGATRVGQTMTDSQGRYGYNPIFEISGSDGQIVNFSVNAHPTIERAVFKGGISTQRNLTVIGASSTMPSTSCSSCSGCSGSACNTSGAGISPTSFPNATAGYPYSLDLNAHGVAMPYGWSIAYGSLPPGLTFDRTLGSIKGVPETAGLYSFTVQVKDSASNYLTLSTCILVKPSVSQSGDSQTNMYMQKAAVTSNFMGSTDVVSLTSHTLASAKELVSEDRRVRLSLAAGTTMNLMGQSVIAASRESKPPAATDGSLCVRSYSFTPPGAVFSPAATMALKYETPLPAGLDESGLFIAWWDGSRWNRLDSQVNTTNSEVTASVSHFTIFAIRGLPASAVQSISSDTGEDSTQTSSGSSKSFAFSNLAAVPETAGPGQQVTISVNVFNSSRSQVTGPVVLKIDGKDETQQAVTVGAGESQTASFTISKDLPGKYTVAIGGLTAGFEVNQDAGPVKAPRISSDVIAAIICFAGLLIVIVILKGILGHRSRD